MSKLGTLTVVCLRGHEIIYPNVPDDKIPPCSFRGEGWKGDCGIIWSSYSWKENETPKLVKVAKPSAWD